MRLPRSRRAGRTVVTAVLAVVWSSGGAPARAAQSPPGRPETAEEAAHRALREYLDGGQGALRKWTLESVPRLCERWLAYARAMGLPEKPADYIRLHESVPPEMRGQMDYWVSAAVTGLMSVDYACPPEEAVSGTTGSKGGIGGRAVLLGGGIVAAGAGILLAGGGGGSGPASTPPPAPPNVTPLHGLYVGRLVTGNPSIPGCGRAATAACNAQVGGSATGTPASLSFGGDLPSSGVLRPTGAMESFRYEGPANGLAATPAGITIVWQQQGTIANNVLTLDGTATVTSPGPCNGAVITTRVEATKN